MPPEFLGHDGASLLPVAKRHDSVAISKAQLRVSWTGRPVAAGTAAGSQRRDPLRGAHCQPPLETGPLDQRQLHQICDRPLTATKALAALHRPASFSLCHVVQPALAIRNSLSTWSEPNDHEAAKTHATSYSRDQAIQGRTAVTLCSSGGGAGWCVLVGSTYNKNYSSSSAVPVKVSKP